MQSFEEARAHLENGNLDKAQAICAQALALEADADAYGLLAEICRRWNDLPAALAHSRRALELAPNHSDLLYAFGALLLKSGSVDDAIEHLDRAIEQRLRFDQAQDAWCVALERRERY
jgi:Tfp pilus assembly protein PilF